MEHLTLENINKETKLKFVVEYLESIIEVDYPMKELSAYELGKGAGKAEILRFLKSRITNKEE